MYENVMQSFIILFIFLQHVFDNNQNGIEYRCNTVEEIGLRAIMKRAK